MSIELISIELTNRCSKACAFCYNASAPGGETRWEVNELVGFVQSCADGGVKAVSFGGGEPLQYEGLHAVLGALQGKLFRSLTTNGLPLRDADTFDALVAAKPDKVHVSIHFPDNQPEVERVIEQVLALEAAGIRSGINLLVARSQLNAAVVAAARVRAAGIGNERIVYLPMRGRDTPTPDEMGRVASGSRFQSMSCLAACGKSPRFCSIGWNRQVAWCSYTSSRRPLPSLDHAGLMAALTDLPLTFCGETNDDAGTPGTTGTTGRLQTIGLPRRA